MHILIASRLGNVDTAPLRADLTTIGERGSLSRHTLPETYPMQANMQPDNTSAPQHHRRWSSESARFTASRLDQSP
jgi:hypothetical protein